MAARLREQFGLERGTKLKKLEFPSVKEFQQRVEERAETIDLSIEKVIQLVHDARSDNG